MQKTTDADAAARAETAWDLTQRGLSARDVARKMSASVPEVFRLLDMHSPVHAARERWLALGEEGRAARPQHRTARPSRGRAALRPPEPEPVPVTDLGPVISAIGHAALLASRAAQVSGQMAEVAGALRELAGRVRGMS